MVPDFDGKLAPTLLYTKSKKEQVELHQSKRLLQRKEKHQQNEKAAHEMGENVCKPHI